MNPAQAGGDGLNPSRAVHVGRVPRGFARRVDLVGERSQDRAQRAVMVDHDRPLGSVLAAFAHEVDAPRESKRHTAHTYRPARVQAVPARLSRAQRRATRKEGTTR